MALSRDDTKRDFATKLGANDYIDGSKEEHGEALQKMGGAALIVVTAPSPSGVASLINGLAPRGKLLILARSSTPMRRLMNSVSADLI